MELSLADKINLYSYWNAHPGHSLAIKNVLKTLGGNWESFEAYIKMRDNFRQNTKAKDVRDKDFFIIKNGVIEWDGYFYDEGDGWRKTQYCGYTMSLKDFIEKYDCNPVAAYEVEGQGYNQLIHDYESDDKAENDVALWVASAIPIKSDEISENLPDGEYFLADCPWEGYSMTIKCPECGSTNMILIAKTDAYFEVDENGLMGNVILDEEGINCINETVKLITPIDDNVEFHCRDCCKSFEAKITGCDYLENIYEVGEEL